MAEHQLPKLNTGVRFPSPAPQKGTAERLSLFVERTMCAVYPLRSIYCERGYPIPSRAHPMHDLNSGHHIIIAGCRYAARRWILNLPKAKPPLARLPGFESPLEHQKMAVRKDSHFLVRTSRAVYPLRSIMALSVFIKCGSEVY